MAHAHRDLVDYFIALTHCSRENAIEYLENSDWRLDQSLNLFFESNSPSVKPLESSKARAVDLVPHASRSPSKSIIIPTVIEFQR